MVDLFTALFWSLYMCMPVCWDNNVWSKWLTSRLFSDHFTCVCLCVGTATFELSDWPRYFWRADSPWCYFQNWRSYVKGHSHWMKNVSVLAMDACYTVRCFWLFIDFFVLKNLVWSSLMTLHNTTTQQSFYDPLFGTTRVSWYQKKHSPTHHPDHYQLFPSTTSYSILLVQITCLAIFLHNLFPCPLWSISWSGALHLIFHTFFHPISVFFSQHMPIPSQPVLLQKNKYIYHY